jgi:hypothetical protein
MKHPETNCTVKADFPKNKIVHFAQSAGSSINQPMRLTHTTRSEHHNFEFAHIFLACRQRDFLVEQLKFRGGLYVSTN